MLIITNLHRLDIMVAKQHISIAFSCAINLETMMEKLLYTEALFYVVFAQENVSMCQVLRNELRVNCKCLTTNHTIL